MSDRRHAYAAILAWLRRQRRTADRLIIHLLADQLYREARTPHPEGQV